MSAGDYIREQRAQEQSDAVRSDQNKWFIPFAAGIGSIALGAMMLKQRLAYGGNTLSNVFNFLGVPQGISLSSDVAANTGKSAARSNTAGIRSILNSSFNVSKNRLQVGPIDIIDDLKTSLEAMSATNHADIIDLIKARTIEYTNRALATGGNNVGYFTQGLERVTFKRVLDDQATWSRVLGQDQFSVIEKANRAGLINPDMVIDKRIFINNQTKELLDLRLRNILTKVQKVDVNGVTSFQRVHRFDVFGQAEVIGSIPGVNRGITILGPGDGYNGTRMFFGGNVYGYMGTPDVGYKEVLLGSGRSLRTVGGALESIAAARQGRIQVDNSRRSKGFFGWMEDNLGIGPAFSSRRATIQRAILDPIARARAIRSGEGVIVNKPYRRGGATKILDATMGAELPEIGVSHSTVVPVGSGRRVGMHRIGGSILPTRVGVLFDLAEDYAVVKRKSYGRFRGGVQDSLTSGDLVVPLPNKGYNIRGRTIRSDQAVYGFSDTISDDLTAVGFKSQSARYKYYDVQNTFGSSTLSGIRDFLAYGLYRTNSLASELGLGFKPSHRISTNMARLAGVAVALEAGRQTALYADYLTERITGVSPIKTIATAYAGARVAQQKIRETIGLQQSFHFLDTYFPGSVNSDGSVLGRSIIAPLYVANFLLGKGKIGGAAVGALATYGLIGGPSPDETSRDLEREYAGDKKVPERKGALWALGYLPFFGGKVDRYDTSWYPKLMSDYRNKSIYGSSEEYWNYHANVFGIPLPTPSNLFGFNNLANPYRLEDINRDSRPYIATSHPISEFPIFGPFLGATVGQLLKPTRYRTPDQLPLMQMALAPPGLTPSMARTLGIPDVNATAIEGENPNDPVNMIARQVNVITEPLGVYKFAMEFFGVKLKPDVGTEYATSSTIGSIGRPLYDSNIGGFFGQTELIRRFVMSDYNSQYRRAAAINPIRNNMPDWMPGAFSASARDRNYFIDFTMGDPFAKIADGEARLPGVGYESLNKLHSGQSGVYDDVDKFLILADVAPYSSAFKAYKKRVENMPLDEEWATKVQEAIEQQKEVVGVDTRYKRYEDDIIDLNMSIQAKAAYAPLRKAYDFLTHDVLAEIPILGSKLFPFRSPYEQYRKMYVEGSEYASWDRPWEDVARPMLYDMALEDPITAAGKGAGLGFLLSGPMRWFNPIKSLVGSPGHTFNLATSAIGAAGGAAISTTRIAAGYSQDMIPFHVRDEEAALEYMDKINYIKGRIIQDMGGGPVSANKTFVGAKTFRDYRSALPRSSDRRYFDYFMQNESLRTQIEQGTPSYMSQGLTRYWDQDFNTRDEADAETLAYINNNPIPDADWLGWRPEISPQATKLRFVQHGLNGISDNIHRFGFYEQHELDLKLRLKDFNEQSITYEHSPMYTSFNQFLTNRARMAKAGRQEIRSYGTPNGRSNYIYTDR